MQRIIRITMMSLVVWCAGCVSLTVNVYFPAAEIKEAAENIEDRVRSGQGAEGLSMMLEALFPAERAAAFHLAFGPREARAQDVDISIETPEITKIIESRTKRYKELKPNLDNGALGEDLSGYIDIIDSKAHDLKTLAGLKKLAKAENDDRTALYSEILKANKIEPTKENMDRVQALFVDAIRKKMDIGHWYETEKGKWIQKTKKP